MTSVKVKFRPSSVNGRTGTLYYQLIHHRVVRQIRTDYKLFSSEWNAGVPKVAFVLHDPSRRFYLSETRKNIQRDMERLQRIIALFDRRNRSSSCEEIIAAYRNPIAMDTLFGFMTEQIVRLRKMGKIRTGETYAAALRSFARFRQERDIPLEELDSSIIAAYEAYLSTAGLSKNTTSFYMRILRAVYNRAVEQELTPQKYPFRHVYTGVVRTTKRAVTLDVLRRMREPDTVRTPQQEFAREMFLWSFYTRGMSFVDMAYLKKSDLKNGVLTYRRKKTGQQLSVRWEKCMQELLDKYPNPHPVYLLPVITNSEVDERRQYKNIGHLVNRNLKAIGEKLGLTAPLTMYVARHTWASLAKSKNIPISVISESMGHDSETTTRIYLASLDTAVVDRANRLVINLLSKERSK